MVLSMLAVLTSPKHSQLQCCHINTVIDTFVYVITVNGGEFCANLFSLIQML